MRPIRFSAFVVVLCSLGFLVQTSQGAGIPWNNANGSSPGFFSWQNGNNETNLFGDPVAIGNSLVFFPSNFRAQSAGGVPDQKFDKASVDITAEGNQAITQINILEIGDYSILGQGASATVVATLVVTPLISNGAPPSFSGMVTNPAMPVTSGGGPWSGNASVSYTLQNGVKKIHLTLDNILQATSDADSAATIDKKLTQGIIIEVVIPEPGTIGFLLCGAPLLLRRRRI
jgi:hypothetical protein